MNSIFKRVSVRQFTNALVEPAKLDLILKAAMAAPSAANQQPWAFYVVENREVLTQLGSISPYATPIKNAPLAIVVCGNKNAMLANCVPYDLSASIQNILLTVTELDLGAVWIAVSPENDRIEKVGNILNLPEELAAFAVIPIGYPTSSKEQPDRFDSTKIHYVR